MIASQEKIVNGGQLVNTAHVDTLLRNYKKERWAQNSQRMGKNDSLSCWFSLEAIEAFLATAKENNADGVKVYFGAYSADYAAQPEYAGLQTVALVATKTRSSEKGTFEKDIHFVTNTGDSSILSINMGKLCPPDCGPSFGIGDIGITIVDKGEGMEVI